MEDPNPQMEDQQMDEMDGQMQQPDENQQYGIDPNQ